MAEWRDRLRWNDIEIFCELAAHGSLRRTADATGLSLETTRRRINALEVSLGERLFRRTAQGLQITTSGREILDNARKAHEAIAAITRQSGADRRRERRRLRVSLPEDIGATFYVPALADGFGRGALTLDIRLADPAAKPEWDDVDIGLSYAAPARSDLRRRIVGQIEFAFFRRKDRSQTVNGPGGEHPLLLPPNYHPIFCGEASIGFQAARAASTAWRINSAVARRDLIAATDLIGLLPCLAAAPYLDRAALDGQSDNFGALELWIGFHPDVGADLAAGAVIDRLIALTAPQCGFAARVRPALNSSAGFHEG